MEMIFFPSPKHQNYKNEKYQQLWTKKAEILVWHTWWLESLYKALLSIITKYIHCKSCISILTKSDYTDISDLDIVALFLFINCNLCFIHKQYHETISFCMHSHKLLMQCWLHYSKMSKYMTMPKIFKGFTW